MAIMVGWLELGLLVTIGLGMRREVKRRGSIARSARIGEGGRINFHRGGRERFVRVHQEGYGGVNTGGY